MSLFTNTTGSFGFGTVEPQIQYGSVEIQCHDMNIRWDITGNTPVGDILEQALGRVHREWSEISRIYFSVDGSLIEWFGTNMIEWRCPVNRLWEPTRKTIKFYISLIVQNQSRRIVDQQINRNWEQKYRQWQTTRDRIWRTLNGAQNTLELINHYVNTMRQEYQPRETFRNPIRNVRTSRVNPSLRDILNIQPERTIEIPPVTNIGDTGNLTNGLLWENILRPMMNAFHENGVNANTTEFIVNFIGGQDEEDNTITLEEFNRISPRYNYVAREGENLQCAITQADITDGMEVRRLPCGHIFSAQSIEEWITRRNRQCPVCRNRVEIQDSGTSTVNNSDSE